MAGRKLGQHFLVRKSILDRIADTVVAEDPAEAEIETPNLLQTVVEIGPGRGALTEYLLPRVDHLIAIEVDPVLAAYLRQKFRDNPKLTIIQNDILKTDITQWGRIAVAGNLPYYITSPIVSKVLALGPLLSRAVFLVQKEVADRITAQPGTRDYGYLSVQVRAYADPRMVVQVPPDAFRPPPKVDSAVVELRPRAEALVPDVPALLRFASLAFRQKRKMLRNNLAVEYSREAIEAQPEATMRAEQLSVEQLASLQNRILKFQ
jgi:16S rRNA (adenine1518-N6/adenine1519-N6)-dimethyltransferase